METEKTKLSWLDIELKIDKLEDVFELIEFLKTLETKEEIIIALQYAKNRWSYD